MHPDPRPIESASSTGPGEASRRPRRMRLGLITLLVLGLAGSGLWLRGQATTKARPVLAASAAALELLAQDVATVVTGQVDQALPFTASLQPLNRSEVKSPLAGQVVQVNAREGQAVRRGQVLVTLDSADLTARLRDRQGALEAGQAQLALAGKTRANNQALLKQNFISQAAFDNADTGFDAAQAAVKSLQAQLALARKALGDAVVRAPIDGVVARRLAEPGLSVPVNATLLELHDLSVMELAVLVPTSQIAAVQVGQRVSFQVEGLGGGAVDGSVERISPSAEPGARSIAVYVRVPTVGQPLRGGMFVQGRILTGRSAPAALLPVAALRGSTDAPSVLRIQQGRLQSQPVTLGARDSASGQVQVLAGVQPGDQVVLSTAPNIADGQAVRLVETPPKAALAAGAGSQTPRF